MNNTFTVNEEMFAPFKSFNEIALSYTEKMIDLNMSVMRKQTEATLSAWREALSLKDPSAMQGYLTNRGEVSRELANSYMEDMKAATALSQEAAEEVRKVFESSIKQATNEAA